MTTRRRFLKTLTTGAAALAAPNLVALRSSFAADKWPQRPVKIVVPFAPGGNTDGIARLMAQQLQDKFGEGFVIENRTAGGGIVAAETVAKADPDGYTLMMTALPQMAILPAMRKVAYEPSDFAPISNIASNPFCLVTNPQFGPKTLKELIDYVRARPGQVNYASGGTGSISHLVMVMLAQKAQLDMVHVPYKGGGPAIADVIGNQAPMYFGNLSEALPYAGKELRPIAVSGMARAAKLPDVPAVAEFYPGFRAETWNGLIAPAKTPQNIIDLLAAECRNAVRNETVLKAFQNYGVQEIGSSPEDFKTTIARDVAQWGAVVKAANIQL